MNGPSDHLSWEELACRDALRTPYPLDWRETRAVVLARLFETIRKTCGDVPIAVLSAYRTVAHNRAIGGAPKSQHVEGRALDLRPPIGWSVDRFYDVIRTVHTKGGIGKYQRAGFVHVDVRPGDRLVAWDGGAQRKEDRPTDDGPRAA